MKGEPAMEQNATKASEEVPVGNAPGSGLFSSTGIKALLASWAALEEAWRALRPTDPGGPTAGQILLPVSVGKRASLSRRKSPRVES